MTETNEIIDNIKQALGGKHVFGTPVVDGETTVIPAYSVAGGGGGGSGDEGGDEESSGSGGGFGLIARPVGALVIRNGNVRWKPAIDVNRIILGGQVVGVAYFLCTWLVARANVRSAIKIAALGSR